MNVRRLLSRAVVAAVILLSLVSGWAQVFVTVVPDFGAEDVNPSSPVVFTFDEPMDSSTVSVLFYSFLPPGIFDTVNTWNGNYTVLTCTPSTPYPPFPPNTQVSWVLSGDSESGDFADEQGFFTTGAASGGGEGSGTNAVTFFSLGKVHNYLQTSTATPARDVNVPFLFSANTSLASNRTATAVSLTLPNAAVSNLSTTITHPELYDLFYFTSVSNQLETTFPSGLYQFFVESSQSNQLLAVTFPASMTQPNVPHISNFSAAQAVNPALSFQLTWDPFVGGTATDYVYVVVGDWTSAAIGTAGALPGTATSVTIPASTLPPNGNYSSQLGFYRAAGVSNVTSRTMAYRASVTQFNLQTTGSSSQAPVVTNASWVSGVFGFDVLTTTGQTLTAIYSTNASLPQAQWQTLLTTNSPGPAVRIVDQHSVTNNAGFYRVRNGL